jgi:cytoskeletal protein RodZ
MTPKTKLSVKKIMKILLLTLSIILLLSGLAGYIVIKRYLGKINMVTSTENPIESQVNGCKPTLQEDTNSIEEIDETEVSNENVASNKIAASNKIVASNKILQGRHSSLRSSNSC